MHVPNDSPFKVVALPGSQGEVRPITSGVRNATPVLEDWGHHNAPDEMVRELSVQEVDGMFPFVTSLYKSRSTGKTVTSLRSEIERMNLKAITGYHHV